MLTHFKHGLFAAITLLSTYSLAAAPVVFPKEIFSDDFSTSAYTGWDTGAAPMNSRWTKASRAASLTFLDGGDAWPDHYVSLSNAFVYKDLEATVTGGFSLTVTMFSESYGRYNWFALTDSTGASGYYVGWDGALSTQYSGEGRIAIGKITTQPASQANPGTHLGSQVQSGHLAAGTSTTPFATVTLTWVDETHTLELWVDGSLKQTIVDSSFSSFSRLYLSGNGGGLYGSVSLTAIPEPSQTAACMILFCLFACTMAKSGKRL